MYQNSKFDKEEIKAISVALKSHIGNSENILNVTEYRDTFGKSGLVVVIPNGVYILRRKKLDNPIKVIATETLSYVRKRSDMLEIGYYENSKERSLVLNTDKDEVDYVIKEISKQVDKAADLRDQKNIENLKLEQEKSAKRGAYIGILKAESGLETFGRRGSDAKSRKLSDLLDGGGNSIEVYEHVIVQSGIEYIVDKYTSAEVTLNGQVQVTHRPTLTRMGLLSPLPGTSLIAGLALSKKTTHDSREVFVTIASSSWTCSTRVAFENLQKAKEITTRLNKICEKMSAVEPEEKNASKVDKISRLAELSKLIESGVVSKEEAKILKNEILKS